MHAMAEWYMRGEQYDQAKLSRILDVAQDLKVSFAKRCHYFLCDVLCRLTHLLTKAKLKLDVTNLVWITLFNMCGFRRCCTSSKQNKTEKQPKPAYVNLALSALQLSCGT